MRREDGDMAVIKVDAVPEHDRAAASKALDWLPEQEVRTVASNREERPRPLWKWGAALGTAPRKSNITSNARIGRILTAAGMRRT